ncbi:MAG: thiamine pyrophosphate-binding protein [Micromonosporaceae bacterium]
MSGRTAGPEGSAIPASRATAAAIAGALSEAGTRLLFGLPGGGPNLDVVGAACDRGIRFVLAHGETAATIMAATYADLTGTPGAVVVTRGPGLASAVNGIAHAALDHLPLVVIADTVSSHDRERISHQRLDQATLGRSVAKAAVTVAGGRTGDAEQAPDGAEQTAGLAVRLALTPPAGPVVVNVDGAPRGLGPAGTGDGDAVRACPRRDDLAPLTAALAKAKRPVMLLGPGALPHTSAVRAAIAGSGIPVLHTYRVRGIVPDSWPEAAGLLTGGTMESPLLSAADLIVGLGVDPVELIPAPWDYSAPTLLVTEDPPGSAAYFTGGAELAAPLPAAIEILASHRAGNTWPPDTGRRAKTAVIRELSRTFATGSKRLTPHDVVTVVRAHTPAETIATVDAGAHMLVAMPLWPVEEPRRLLISSGLATMGYALPAAIAAALCAPGRPVVAFTGDGGLGMALMEIETAVRLRLPIVVVVFNDAALSLIKIKQRPYGQGGAEAVGYCRTSFAGVATAMGAAGVCVTGTAELTAAITAALGREGPTLIDAHVDPGAYPAVMDLTRGETGRRLAPESGARDTSPPLHPLHAGS